MKKELQLPPKQELASSTLLKLPAIYEPKNLHRYPATTTAELIELQEKNPQFKTLAMIARNNGVDWLENKLKLHLVNLNILLEVKNPLNEAQIDFISADIVKNYPQAKLSDFVVFCKQIVSGKFGEVYENLSPPKVLRWWENFQVEKFLLIEDIAHQHHTCNKEKNEAKDTFWRKEILNREFSQILKGLKK